MWYWGALTLIFLMCCVGSWASYTDFKKTAAYLPLIMLMGCGCSLLFGYAARRLDDNAKLYVFSLGYDSGMMFAYYVLPIALFSTRLTPAVVVGAVLVIAGLLVVHIYG